MIDILFENEDLLVVDKPAGVAVIAERDRTRPHLLRMLGQRRQNRLYVVHRLDKAVSGVLLFAKHAAAHRFMNAQFAGRLVDKTYLAVVHGKPPRASGIIEAPLRVFGSGRTGVDPRRGKLCETRYHLKSALDGYSLLEVHPITGRRHQIRVHLYTLGHPVAGDQRYGDAAVQTGYPRLMLHALKLQGKLPSGTTATFETPVPKLIEDFAAAHGGGRVVFE